MNAHSMTTRSIKNGSNNMDKFVNELHTLLKINMEAQKHLSYHGMMIRLKSVINVAKMINDGFEHVFHKFVARSIQQTGKLMSTMYFKMYEMLTESKNAHLKEYIVGENEILNIKKMALKIINPCRKSMNIVFKLIQKFVESDISRVCYINNYHNIKNIQSQLENKYMLRKITAICYAEDNQVDDLSDSDYNPAEDLVKKINRINKCNNDSDSDYDDDNDDNDSDYNPEDDADDVDDEFEFDDDDYAEESEEDDDDYEDEDSVDDEDAQFVSDYFNDPDYEEDKKVKKTSDNDDDYEYEDDADDVDDDFHFNDDDYAEETEEDDDDYEDEESQNLEDKQFLDDYYNDPDYEEDKKANKNSDDDSDYDPADDADAESVDDNLEFDDDDYAEETEEDDDDYEETEIDEKEDAQFVSDYYNDPDYEEEEDNEDCNIVNDDIQLEGGINYDEDSETEEIDLSEYERNIVYNYKNNKLENVEFKMYEIGM